MARLRKDAVGVPMDDVVDYTVPIKWVSAEKVEDQYFYPNGLLEVSGCDIGNHRIARYKSRDDCWSIRLSKLDEETFAADRLDGFLAVRPDLISWQPVRNNRLPKNKYFISELRPGEKQKCIGKHPQFGVGYVTRDAESKTLTFYQENESVVTGFEILCINRPN